MLFLEIWVGFLGLRPTLNIQKNFQLLISQWEDQEAEQYTPL